MVKLAYSLIQLLIVTIVLIVMQFQFPLRHLLKKYKSQFKQETKLLQKWYV